MNKTRRLERDIDSIEYICSKKSQKCIIQILDIIVQTVFESY